jgi:hypothetical protein
MTRSLTGLTGTLRASRDRRNRLAGERAARLVADGAVRDDNSDDSCSLNHDRYNAEAAPCPLLAVWWSGSRGGGGGGVLVNGYRRAGAHRLFTANDPEPTGIARLPLGVRDSQSGCRTTRTGNNRDCQDLRIANPLIAGSSPARPTSEPILSVRRRQLIDHASFTRALSG